jgi:hypothetical protein
MNATPVTPATRPGWAGTRRQAVTAAIAVVGLALLGAGCSSVFGHPSAPSSSAGTGGGGAGPAQSGTGGGGHVTLGNRTGGRGKSTSGSFTLAFARCMRANGVQAFPDPNGHAGQLGPGSGIDPTSPQFQAAINGPCRSLAPPGWVGSGKVTAPGAGAS